MIVQRSWLTALNLYTATKRGLPGLEHIQEKRVFARPLHSVFYLKETYAIVKFLTGAYHSSSLDNHGT